MNEQQSDPNSLSLQDVGYAQHQEIQHLRAELANMQAKLAEREKQFTDALAALRADLNAEIAYCQQHRQFSDYDEGVQYGLTQLDTTVAALGLAPKDEGK